MSNRMEQLKQNLGVEKANYAKYIDGTLKGITNIGVGSTVYNTIIKQVQKGKEISQILQASSRYLVGAVGGTVALSLAAQTFFNHQIAISQKQLDDQNKRLFLIKSLKDNVYTQLDRDTKVFLISNGHANINDALEMLYQLEATSKLYHKMI